MNTEQERTDFEAWYDTLRELVLDLCSIERKSESTYEQRKDAFVAVMRHCRAAMQSQDREDAELLRAMAAEWDRARRGVDSYMPIWEALCEAIGNDADGTGMREAIDHARRIEENK